MQLANFLLGDETVSDVLESSVLWFTMHTAKDCAAGQYSGAITVVSEQFKPVRVPAKLTVWDFILAAQTHLRTMTWLSEGSLRKSAGITKLACWSIV